MGLTAQAAAFVTSLRGPVPADVAHLAKRSILDGLGVAVAGSRSHAFAIVRDEILRYGRLVEEASVLGTTVRLPARFASLLNGLAIHADDYDDTQLAVAPDRVYGLLTHPTAPVLPAVLALGERDDRSGADVLMAYLAGVEVETKVSEAIDPRHYRDGFHSTGTVGAIGSAAASARLLGLDQATTSVALGIAASQAAGLRENFGTMTKPFHAGRAAESGVVAATLAQAGFTATDQVLEAPRGFFQAAGGGYDPSLIDGRFGAPWTFADPGVSIKPHPSGSLTHPAMGAFEDLVRLEGLSAHDVERIRVGANRYMPAALIHHRPTTELEAKFSMEFCLAILLLEGRAGLAEFTDEVVNRPDVRAMVERITFEADPAADAGGYREMTALIEVELRDGRTLLTEGKFAKGSPANPMSDDELIAKFAECLAWASIPASTAASIADEVLELDHRPSISTVLEPLRGDWVPA